ncbi:hypothetical protein CYLTODRAFT_416434 [Cylindrobasidium torrendii FP15055 ss-10]|uniref:FAD-binding domain-containing protein n=1 Tax=Cylindrobasidium torrendii FP15055 ss-10 TaxID=1314674 RepID=A0A0D7BUK6_9AGAR|nr:hypothetical protein CYLTODRAFT_416434 [Cylindrobasidium torrendii FP15055 ss-10]
MVSPVLICGGGPTGLVMAISLLQNGVPVRIVDKLKAYRIGFKGSGIQPRSLEVYKLLGLLDDVYANTIPVPERMSHLPNGETQTGAFIAHVEPRPDRPHNNGRQWSQERHEGFLRDHLERTFGCIVELGVEVTTFEQNEDCVKVSLLKHDTDGDAEVEIFETPFLVGADGAHSSVRKHLGLTFLGGGHIVDSPFVAGDIFFKKHPLGNTPYVHQFGDRSTNAAIIRQWENMNNQWNFIASGPQLDIEQGASGREGAITMLRKITGLNEDVLEFGDLTWISVFQPQARTVDKFSSGRVFVSGDAAHIHSPVGGQGLNTSIQDSFNLAWKMALVLKGHSSQSILDSYNLERLPVVATMLEKTTSLTKVYVKQAPGQEIPRAYELRQFGVNYRGSPLVCDDFYNDIPENVDYYRSGEDGEVHAGDRAPDAPGLVNSDGAKTTLFDAVFRATHHSILVFSEKPIAVKLPTIPAKLAYLLPPGAKGMEAAGGEVFVDSDGLAGAHYRVAERGVHSVIVRPDGYIGAVLKTEEGITRYFSHFSV